MVKVIWTELAINDLKSLHEYISKDSEKYANRFIESIIINVDQLKVFPNLGRKIPEFNSESIRELFEGNYRIVYRMNTEQIGIIRIHHSAKQLNLI